MSSLEDDEPELESWLRQRMSDFDQQVEGASAAEIAEIEAIAERPLPRFYRWFLSRMGRQMGCLSYATQDFSAARVLRSYRNGAFKRSPDHLMIAFDSDDIEPLHVAYDFAHASRDDFRTVVYEASGEIDWTRGYDTFREMFARRALLEVGVLSQPHRVHALLEDDITGDVPSLLDPIMQRLGFWSPIETGAHCRLYDRGGAAMICRALLDSEGPDYLNLSLGASTEGELRSILGQIVTATGLELSIDSWDPRTT